MLQGGPKIVHVLQDMTSAIMAALPRELLLGGPLDFVEFHGAEVGLSGTPP